MKFGRFFVAGYFGGCCSLSGNRNPSSTRQQPTITELVGQAEAIRCTPYYNCASPSSVKRPSAWQLSHAACLLLQPPNMVVLLCADLPMLRKRVAIMVGASQLKPACCCCCCSWTPADALVASLAPPAAWGHSSSGLPALPQHPG